MTDCPVVLPSFAGKAVPSQLSCFCTFVKGICVAQFQCFLFCFIDLCASPLTIPAQSWLLQQHRKTSYQHSDSHPSFFLVKIVVAIPGPTPFRVHFSISPSVSTKVFAGIWIGISPKLGLFEVLSSQTQLGQ